MKQTNNAIKFLMAQYRAIFKKANIAMVAAMVAAALAAGQAQAAADTTNPDKIGTSELNDNALTNEEVKLDSGNKTVVLDAANSGSIALNKDGKITLTTNATSHIFTKNDLVVNSGGSISLTGSDSSKDVVAGLVGAAKDVSGQPQAVPTASLTINKGGQLDVTSSFAMMKDVNINGTVNISGSTGKNTADAQSGEYLKYAAVYAETGNLTVGSDAAVTLGAASHLYGQNIAINGGTIAFEGTTASGKDSSLNAGALLRAGDSKNGGALTISNGKLNVVQGKSGDIVATTLNMNGGEINVSGSLGIGGNYHDNAPAATINVNKGKVTVATGGKLVLEGEATFADGTVANSGTIEALEGSKINVANTTGLFSADGQLMLTGATLNYTGATLDLSDTAANISGDASSTVLAEKATVTLATGFESKAANVSANTVIAKTGDFALDHSPADKKQAKTFLIKSGTVTAYSELKGAESGAIIQVFDPAKTGTAKLVLGADEASVGKLTNVAKVNVGHQGTTATQSTLTVNGKWDFGGARLNAGAAATVNIKEGAVISNVERLQIGGTDSDTVVNIDGTANIQRLIGNVGTGKINVAGTLNIKGDGKDNDASTTKPGEFTNDVQLTKVTLNINAGGTVSLEKDAWDDVIKIESGSKAGVSNLTVVASGDKTTDFGGWNRENVALNAGGTLRIDLKNLKVADKAAVEKLAQDLVKDGSKGLVDLGGIGIDTIDIKQDGTIDITNMPNVKTEATKNLEVNVGSTTLTGSYSMGSANVSGDKLTTAEGSTLEFNNAKNGQFATNTAATGGADSKVNVTLAANSAVNLNGDGSLGDIKKSGDGTAVVLGGENGTQKVGVVDVETFNQVGGNVTTKGAITATGATTVSGVLNAGGDVSTKTLELSKGAIKAGDNNITVTDASKPAKIFGDVEASSLSLAGGALIAGGADVKLDSLTGANNTKIQVGEDTEGGLGATVTTTNLVLNGGSIFVDPDWHKPAGFVVTEKLKTNGGSTASGSGTLDGNAYVGKNAALGIGFANTDAGLAELKALVAPYLVDNGGFAETGVKNALVINDNIKVESGKGIAVDATLTSTNYITSAPSNEIKLGAGAALVVTDKALDEGAKAAITFVNNTASLTAGDGAKVVLVGDFTAADNGQKIFAADNGSAKVTGTVKVEAAGGLLVGQITDGSIASLALAPDAEKAIRSEVSAPVGQLFVDFANGKFDGATGAGYDFVVDAISGKQFKAVDAAAHAATYAGAQQAAVVSVTTMADAMFGRVGAVGVEAASIAATGSQANGGVWLTPMYKSMDADGFNAEGVSYGSDVDAAGVAFGADTVNGNMRFGAVFNIGSGDAEGKGQGNGLKDEFDYYGFGIYSAMGFGNLALIGDASVTVVSHDVQGLGLRGKADTTAVTMGLTGQYTVSTPMVDVTPHLGARFIRLNTDSYDLVGADGAIATTDFDVQNVFSVPLGVTLSKGFTTGGWTLAPSADLTITFNGGDTEAKSSTTFTGIKAINMNTEVLDEVTYGLTLGLGAQYGAFGTSFGLNYTGSENTDSFGVNAQCRYMF